MQYVIRAPAAPAPEVLRVASSLVASSLVAPTPAAVPVAVQRPAVLVREPATQGWEVAIVKPRVQPYAHRTFMGLAGSMLKDPAWSTSLRQSMPDLYARCCAPDVSIVQAMRLLEGNPVLAAYGLSRGEDKALPMEWDLWLDPARPADLDAARVIHGNAVATDLANSPRAHTPGVAADVMAGRTSGTDVHEGLTPLRWLDVFGRASRSHGLALTCADVYLDVKSAWSSASDVAAFITALEYEHVRTRGVLAFDFNQLASPLNVPHPVHLAHSPAGLAMALERVPQGAMVMFNGGALLRDDTETPVIDGAQLSLAQKMHRERGVRIGVYLQEDAISPAALSVLIAVINREADTFASGIAYGGLAGVAEGGVAHGTGRGCQAAIMASEQASFYARHHG